MKLFVVICIAYTVYVSMDKLLAWLEHGKQLL